MNNVESDRNRRIAESMCRDFAWEGQIFHEGECVALLDGRIVAIADNPDEAIAALRALDPNPLHGMVVLIEPPNVDVVR